MMRCFTAVLVRPTFVLLDGTVVSRSQNHSLDCSPVRGTLLNECLLTPRDM